MVDTKHRYDKSKVREVILYVLNKCNIDRIEKLHIILYFATKQHLSKYGRLIFQTDFIAREWGVELVAVTETLAEMIADGDVIIEQKTYFSMV